MGLCGPAAYMTCYRMSLTTGISRVGQLGQWSGLKFQRQCDEAACGGGLHEIGAGDVAKFGLVSMGHTHSLYNGGKAMEEAIDSFG
jgi:hypothetical protein